MRLILIPVNYPLVLMNSVDKDVGNLKEIKHTDVFSSMAGFN